MTTIYDISMISGDGIGPELAESASMILDVMSDKFGTKFNVNMLDAGDHTLEKIGTALPEDTVKKIKESDAF